MFIDYKTTVWERFEIEDKHKESLLKFLEENPEALASEIYDHYCENGGDPHRETIEGTSEEMSVDENGTFSTIEIICDDKIIFQNGANNFSKWRGMILTNAK
jgi:hypothetical protein